MTRILPTSAFSLGLGYVALGIIALILFAAPLWYAWHVTIQDGRDEILQSDAQRLTEVFNHAGADGLRKFIDARVDMQIAGERVLLLTDAALKPLAGNLATWPQNVPERAGTFSVRMAHGDQVGNTELVHVRLAGGYQLLVGRDLERFVPLERRFWYGLAGATAMLSIAGLVIGLLTRRALLARIHGIRQTVSAIIQGDLKYRLPIQQSGTDELNTLSRTINGMLDQIELLIHGVRNVSNSIAHDLRTPLAELRSRLEELALTRPPADATFAEVDAAVADVDRVIRIFDALLRLAEIDAGMRRSGFVPLDLTEVASAAVEFYSPAAELKSIDLAAHVDGPLPIAGDPLLLAQALGNLIDNSLKYAPVGGAISVEAWRDPRGVTQIVVADDGPGISDTEKPRVVERFYRGDVSRGTPGVGLGLSLVQAVAKLHGSTLELIDGHPGLRAQMQIQASALIDPATPAVATATTVATGAAILWSHET